MHDLVGRCAAIRTVDGALRSVSEVGDEKERLLVDHTHGAVTENGADVVILAGAPLSGLADRVRDGLPVPVID